MKILDGKALSKAIRGRLKGKALQFQKKYGKRPGLAVLRAGSDPASALYVQKKLQACKGAGFQSFESVYPASVSFERLKKDIQTLNQSPEAHAVLVQLPLPQSLDKEKVLSLIRPDKDPDGLTVENRGLLWSGRPRVIPCTALAVLRLLQHGEIPLAGKKAVTAGRSQITGLPVAACLLQNQATVTVCHSRTPPALLHKLTKEADIVIAAAGKRGLFSKKDFKKGAAVIDVGIHREGKRLTGDVSPDGLESRLSALSPVPGGVGPMTIAMLLENTLSLAESLEAGKGAAENG